MIRKSLFLFFFVYAVRASAQLTAPSPSTGSLSVPPVGSSMIEKASAPISPDAMIFDGAIDPKEYKMGPGDVLGYRSWTSNDAQQLMISADELLVIPRVGEFYVNGKSFAQVKEEVRNRAAVLFKKSKIATDSAPLFSLSLIQPRRIIVSVTGEVTTPGVYTYTGATRAIVAVSVANRPAQHTAVFGDEAFEKEQEKRKREQDRLRPYLGRGNEQIASTRNIIVTHSDGTTDRIDIPRFTSTRDSRFCPLMREGDVIYVPFKRPLAGQIGVYGAVYSPQDFEYIEGDSLWAMIRASMGPTSTADLSHVELTRMNPNGESFTTELLDCAGIKAGRTPDVKLEADDRIFVRDNPDLRELSRVIVKGEVLHPGVYPIHRTDSKLSEIIRAAGGLTPYAFIPGGTVTRQKIDIDNKDITSEDEAKLVGRLANLRTVDTTSFRVLSELRQTYVSVNMQKLFEQHDAASDVVLRDGDVISIPSAPNTVYVWGYVGSVGFIPYQPGAKVDYYVQAAGGYAEGSDKSLTRVIKARTRRWVKPDETLIEQGDEVIVPKEGTYPDDYTLRTTSLIVGIVATIVSAVFTVVLITRK